MGQGACALSGVLYLSARLVCCMAMGIFTGYHDAYR